MPVIMGGSNWDGRVDHQKVRSPAFSNSLLPVTGAAGSKAISRPLTLRGARCTNYSLSTFPPRFDPFPHTTLTLNHQDSDVVGD